MIQAVPHATMRLQLHKDFTFEAARQVIPYCRQLGISHVYTSPVVTARPGSMHGYDVTDPTRVNPELGGEEGLRAFSRAVREAGLGLIVDIVPNHMAVGGSENPWWADVLQNGRKSRYASFFDIDWECANPTLQGKVLAPFLGKPYGEALQDGDLHLQLNDAGAPVIAYYDNIFPIDRADHAAIIEAGIEAFSAGSEAGRKRLHELLERQHYRLAWWGVAGDEINWRRFFDINGLAGLRVERPEVFDETHATLLRLYTEGVIDGFRVDHVDGLSDPGAYCRRLRQSVTELEAKRPPEAAQGRAYIVVEKILGPGEVLPTDWEVDGTTGYDFMNDVSAVQHDQHAAVPLGEFWHQLTGRPEEFEPEEVKARHEIMEFGFSAQLDALTDGLHRLALTDPRTRDVAATAIRRGLVEILAHFPSYRIYGLESALTGADRDVFTRALNAAKQTAPAPVRATLDYIANWLIEARVEPASMPAIKATRTRLNQLSAPVAAKAVEDTAFYRYGRLLSRNDVGFDVARVGGNAEAFHQACLQRQSAFPNAMLATATHDHKRGEDVRARLAVLSEDPDAWIELVSHCRSIDAERPSPADEAMLYQMIVGAWPLELSPSDTAGCKAFAERLAGWQQKALREAKLATSWAVPNEDYEAKAKQFLEQALDPAGPFLPVLAPFVERIAPAGAVNGIAQMVLKATAPGTPDFFQGTEFWDFSLVDPDNRRPVDFATRTASLKAGTPMTELLSAWQDGRIKQAIMQAILAIRQRSPILFSRGDYVPLTLNGPTASHFIAFARRMEQDRLVVLTPRLPLSLSPSLKTLSLDKASLRDTTVQVPAWLRGTRVSNLFGGDVTLDAESLPVGDLLQDHPVSVLFSAK